MLFSFSAFAGDLDELPETEKAFREKIESFIKLGSNVKDAVSILEAYRFKCEEIKNEKNNMWCSRTDSGVLSSVVRRYQVILKSENMRITRVKTSTGLVGL
jgi:hypothetical protein